MRDPIVSEIMNAKENETSFFTETNYQAPLTYPPYLLSELALCVPDSKGN